MGDGEVGKKKKNSRKVKCPPKNSFKVKPKENKSWKGRARYFTKTRMILCLPETFLARFPVSVMSSFIVPRPKRFFFLMAPPLVASAFGRHGRFPPHARKTSGYPGYQNDNIFWWEEENLCLNKRRQDKINYKLINNSFKNKIHYYITQMRFYRGTQRQFSEYICLEDDLRSRIFGTFVVKFLACLLLLRFSNI